MYIFGLYLDSSYVIVACQDNEPTMRELERRLLPTMARVVSGEGACFEYLDTILEMMVSYFNILNFLNFRFLKINPCIIEFFQLCC